MHASEQTGAVVVVGGHGRMSSRYRDVAREHGYSLKHFEQRIPPGSHGRISLVVVMVGMVSHSLRDQIRDIAGDTPVVYVRTASITALRTAVTEKLGPPPMAGPALTRRRTQRRSR